MGNDISFIKAQITCTCDTLSNRCLGFIGGKWGYVCNLEENLKTLEKSCGDVVSIRDDMLTRINLAERQGKKRLKQVVLWLSRVDDKTKEIDELLKIREPETAKLCLGCCSTNCCSSYEFGKKVDRMTKEVNELINEAKEFKELATVTIPEQKIVLLVEATVGLESTLQEINRYVMDENVGIVGIFGESGIGKSTILKVVNNAICQDETSSFDLVMLVKVSKQSVCERIQDDIGKKIGFSGPDWISKTFNEKAIDISHVLQRKKFVLLLDDILESISLTYIGIPLRETNMMSKVIFTSNSQRICSQMLAQKVVKVSPLSTKDSWCLFCERFGDENLLKTHSQIHGIAKEIVSECGGVPSTLIKMAHRLSCIKTPNDWLHALKTLRGPLSSVGLEIPYPQEIIECSGSDDKSEEDMAELIPKLVDFVQEKLDLIPGDAEFRKAIESAISLRRETDDEATIVIFCNATGGTIKFSSSGVQSGSLQIGKVPYKVKNGQWGVFCHLSNHPTHPISCGGVAYNLEDAPAEKIECEWMMAWHQEPLADFPQVYTEVQKKYHFKNSDNWIPVYRQLAQAGRVSHSRLGNCESKMCLIYGWAFAVLK